MLTTMMYATVYVTDQDKALEFYRDKLGLKVKADYPGPEGRFLTVAVEESPVEIILWATDQPQTANHKDAEPGVVPGPIILGTADLQALFGDLAAQGVTFEESAPVDYPFGVRITALDPDGNRVSLRQPRAPK